MTRHLPPPRKPVDMIGKRYGRLEVLQYSHSSGNKRRYLCRCDCGTAKIIAGIDLRTGGTISCGCRQLEIYAALRTATRSKEVPHAVV